MLKWRQRREGVYGADRCVSHECEEGYRCHWGGASRETLELTSPHRMEQVAGGQGLE